MPFKVGFQDRLDPSTQDGEGGGIALTALDTLDPLDHRGWLRLVEWVVRRPARVPMAGTTLGKLSRGERCSGIMTHHGVLDTHIATGNRAWWRRHGIHNK